MFVRCVLLACIALLLVVKVTAQVSSIEVEPSDATVTEGNNFTITCTISSPSLSPRLNINGVLVSNDPRVDQGASDITSDNFTIQFTYLSVTPEDNGITFQCDSTLTNLSANVTLIVLYRPILDDLADVGVFEGADATVTLTANANPAVTSNDVTLVRDNVPEYTVAIDGQMITISLSNVMRDNAGSYTVEVANSEGMNNDMFTLNVYYGPTFTDMNSTIIAAVGDRVPLDCSVAESNPVANVTYTPPDSSTGVEFMNDIIDIASATLDNSGTYTCTADSGQAQATLIFTLDVGNPPSSDIEVIVTATYDEDNVLTVRIETDSTDDTIMYEVVLTYSGGRISVGNYTLAELTDIERDDITTFNPMLAYTVEVIAYNRYGRTPVGEGQAMFMDPTTMATTEGTGVTIATTALVLMMVIISLML